MAANPLQYGARSGPGYVQTYAYPVAASEIFKKAGGGFVNDDGSGRIRITGSATATNMIGWAVLNENFTASATAGATILPVNIDLDSVYEIIINTGTYAATQRGLTCDLSLVSNVQGVALGASAIDIVEIVDKGFTNAAGTVISVLVKIFQKNLTRGGVV